MPNKNLQFIRLTEPAMFSLIPRSLFEQVEDESLIIDNVYKFGPVVITNPLVFFFALLDNEKQPAEVVGFVWSNINLFSKRLQVGNISVDKSYQNNGIKEKIKTLLCDLCRQKKLSPIVEFVTQRPEIFERRFGCKKTKERIMEWNTENHNGKTGST